MDKKLIEEINALSRKSRSEGLTSEEKERQKELREEYLKQFRSYFRKTLDNIDITYVEDENKE